MEKKDLQRFAELSVKKKELKDALDAVKTEIYLLGGPISRGDGTLLDQFVDEGIQTIRTTGKNARTIYVHRTILSRPANGLKRHETVEGVRAAGFGDLIKEDYSTQSLDAAVRDMLKEDEELEPNIVEQRFDGKIEVFEEISLRARK